MFANNINDRSAIEVIFGAAGLILLCCVMLSPVAADTADTSIFQPGIRNGRGDSRLNAARMKTVAEALGSRTGFLQMGFDGNGWLRFDGGIGRGSETARQLIRDAFIGCQVIEIYSRDRSPEVAFARMVTSEIVESDKIGKRITIYHLEIDFSDFALINGDREARAAFDLGFILLHELTHCVRQIYDNNASQSTPGDCADFINHIRMELGLPVRSHYFPEIRKQAGSTGTSLIARLNFSSPVKRRYQLFWDAGKVGNIR